MAEMRTMRLITFLLVVLLLAACGGNNPAGSPETATPEPLAQPAASFETPAGFPEFPGPGAGMPVSPSRRVSEDTLVVDGSDFVAEDGSGNYTPPEDTDSHVLVPGGEDELLAYAYYHIDTMDTERPDEISIEVDSAPLFPGGEEDLPLNYYIGVANYSEHAWEWHGPYTEPLQLTLNSEDIRDRYVSADGDFYYALLTQREARSASKAASAPGQRYAVRINRTVINSIATNSSAYFQTRPVYTPIDSVQLTGTAIKRVEISWTEHPDNYAVGSSPTGYQVARLLFAKGQSREILGIVEHSPFFDPTFSDPDVSELIPGARYIYFLRAVNPQTGTSAWSHSGLFQIPLAAPRNVAASDGQFPDQIEITWDEVTGATGYRIFRDELDGTAVATVGAVTRWDDTSAHATDGGEHTYAVKAFNQYAVSDASEPDTGFVYTTLADAPADTILAVPMKTDVAVGEEFTVVVHTGPLSNPVLNMNGCRILVAGEAEYVPNSFDTGEPDGNNDPAAPVDGLWTTVNPSSFLLGEDSWRQFQDLGGGMWASDLNVTTLGGSDASSATGPLCNFRMRFEEAGTYHLNIIRYSSEKRTYYSDSQSNEYNWDDYDNDTPGFANTVTVY